MIRTKLFKQTFILLLIIGLLNYVATEFYFYWTIWWFDMMMHFIAGVCVGMATVLIWRFYHKEDTTSYLKTIKIVIFSIIFVGVLWELYELYIEVASFSEGINYITDTSSDLMLDICGAILGSIYAHRLIRKDVQI